MELRHLAYAVAVARSGSFSAAAADLHMSQPSLSAAIAQLEVHLGAQLFDRSSRGVAPTAAGAYVLRQAQRILRDVDTLEDNVRSMVTGAMGVLSLAIAPVLAWNFAPPLMRSFGAEFPAVELNVREANAGEVIELIIEGTVDVGLVATASSSHLSDFHRGTLIVEKLGTVALLAALPARYRDSPDPLTLAQIAHEPLALPPASVRTFGLRAGVLAAFDKAGLPAPRMRDVPSLFEAIPLAMSDLAVGFVPERMRLNAPDLVLRSLVDGPAPLDVSLLYRPPPNGGPLAAEFARVALQSGEASAPRAEQTPGAEGSPSAEQ